MRIILWKNINLRQLIIFIPFINNSNNCVEFHNPLKQLMLMTLIIVIYL